MVVAVVVDSEVEMAGELSRDAFVREMVALLRQGEAGGAPAAEPQADAAREAFKALGFDMPIVPADRAAALACELRQRLRDGDAGLPEWFWLCPRVLEGVRFCLFERARDATEPETLAALREVQATALLGVLERMLDVDTPREERQRVVARGAGAGAVRERLLAAVRRVSYEALGALRRSEWEQAHVTASCFRLLRAVVQMNAGTARRLLGEGDHEAWVADMRAEWPRFLFVVRDRLSDAPEEMQQLLPPLLDMAKLGCGEGSGMLQGSLAAVARNRTLAAAPAVQRACLWEALHRQVVPGAGRQVEAALRVGAGDAEGPRLERELGDLLDLLAFYGGGDPRRAMSQRTATDQIVKAGVIRALVMPWLSGHDAMPRLFPSPANASAAEVDTRVQRLLFLSSLRDPQVLSFLTKVPGFVARATADAEAAPLDTFAWSAALSCGLRDEAERAPFDAMCEARLASLSEQPLDAPALKLAIDLVERLSEPELLRAVRGWHLRPTLVGAIKRLRSRCADAGNLIAASRSAVGGENPQQESPRREVAEVPDEDKGEGAGELEKEQLAAARDRAARAGILLKRLLCRVEDVASKAD